MELTVDPATFALSLQGISLNCDSCAMLVSLLKFFAVSVGKRPMRQVVLVQRGSIDASI